MKTKSRSLTNKVITTVYTLAFIAFILVTSIMKENVVLLSANIVFNLTSFAFGVYVLTNYSQWLDNLIKKDYSATYSNRLKIENKILLIIKMIWFVNLFLQPLSIANIDFNNLVNDYSQVLWFIQIASLAIFAAVVTGIIITTRLIAKFDASIIDTFLIEMIIGSAKETIENLKIENSINESKVNVLNFDFEVQTEQMIKNDETNLVVESKLSSIMSNDKKATTPPHFFF